MTSSTETNRAVRFPHERQQEIYFLALQSGAVDVSELARQFEVTTETIRRDLSDLQARNLVRRVPSRTNG
jgi:DeoR family transcriptional regulator, fructose operon transcriptional repressor